MSDLAERYAREPSTDMDIDDGTCLFLTTDPSVRRRGRGFGPGASDDLEGVKSGGFERLDAATHGADEHAARCMS